MADICDAALRQSAHIVSRAADPDEITRLRAEVTSLTIDLQHAYGEVAFQVDKVTIHGEAITRLTAENEKLRADIAYADKHAAKVESLLWGTAQENEKLRATLEPLACTCDRPNGAACSRSEVDCPFWNARTALEGK